MCQHVCTYITTSSVGAVGVRSDSRLSAHLDSISSSLQSRDEMPLKYLRLLLVCVHRMCVYCVCVMDAIMLQMLPFAWLLMDCYRLVFGQQQEAFSLQWFMKWLRHFIFTAHSQIQLAFAWRCICLCVLRANHSFHYENVTFHLCPQGSAKPLWTSACSLATLHALVPHWVVSMHL